MAVAPLPHLNASLFDSRTNGGSGQSDSDEEEDLYEGTSSGASHRNLAGARPLTVQNLLESRPKFVAQEDTKPTDDIPYIPINLVAQVSPRLAARAALPEPSATLTDPLSLAPRSLAFLPFAARRRTRTSLARDLDARPTELLSTSTTAEGRSQVDHRPISLLSRHRHRDRLGQEAPSRARPLQRRQHLLSQQRPTGPSPYPTTRPIL